MDAIGLLTIFAAGSADANQNTIGLVIGVSLATALITSIIVVYAFRNSVKNREETEASLKEDVIVPESYTEKPVQAASAPLPVINNGISDEVIAVIAAAVASMAPEGKKYTVRSVNRVRSQRPVWAVAGLAESTRPF